MSITTNVVPCDADLNNDGSADAFDVIDFTARFDDGDLSIDQNNDGMLTETDVMLFVALVEAGCP